MKISSESGFRKNNNNPASHDQHKTIYDTWNEFVKLWKNGQDAAFNANCRNGRAWLNFSTLLYSTLMKILWKMKPISLR